jgi:hypothetical protein
VPVGDCLDGVRIGIGSQDVPFAVGLTHAFHELLVLEGRDAPGLLIGVWKLHAEAVPGDPVEQVPVVVERGIDVDGDAGHAMYRTRS